MTRAAIYCTSAELKAYVGITDSVDDANILKAINAASDAIDGYCNRRFYALTQTKIFTPVHPARLLVEDLLSITTLLTDENGDGVYEVTWTATDWAYHPINAPTSIPNQPYWAVNRTYQGNYVFPTRVLNGVSITGSWGFSTTTPDAVNQACLLEAARLFKRKNAVFGAQTSPEFGVVNLIQKGLDPDAAMLLNQGGFVRLI